MLDARARRALCAASLDAVALDPEVERLDADAEQCGGGQWKASIPDALQARPSDLVDRNFTTTAPNRLPDQPDTYTCIGPCALSSGL